MEDRLTTYERRESIRLLLMKRRSIKIKYLVDMFGVTKQTILNDIVFLSSRIPITTKTGKRGGIFLDMEFDSPREFLSVEEEQLLLHISETLSKREQVMIFNIINKFSLKADN